MKFDTNYRPPVGFEPYYQYPDGDTAIPVVGYGIHNGISFCLQERIPSLPLKVSGKLWHTGWDIPTYYAIDADNYCWKDWAHGGSLDLVEPSALIADIEDELTRNSIKKLLGMKEDMPGWAKTALANGWTPPEGWTY